jgi:hypothetical protein
MKVIESGIGLMFGLKGVIRWLLKTYPLWMDPV